MRRVKAVTLFFVIIFSLILVSLCACGPKGTKEQETVSYIGSGSKYDEQDGIEESSMTDIVEHEDSSQHYESSNNAESTEHEDQGQYDDYYNDYYTDYYDDYRVDDLLADIEELEDQIRYYEGLCDIYGYLPYDFIYNPEIWKYYVDIETGIAHNDWLCDEFDHSHECHLVAELDSFNNATECSKCSGTKIVFLDVNTGVFHSEKRHLDLGTDDYLNIRVLYRFVSIENALKHGYTYCDCCTFN